MLSSDESAKFRYAYCLELLSCDLQTLVDKYPSIEHDIEDEVFQLFLEQLELKGAQPQGNMFTIDGAPLRVKMDPTGTDRNLRLYLIPWGAPSVRTQTTPVEINHFGLVRKICIEWPEAVMAAHESLPTLLGELVRDRYIELQVLFVSKYAQLTDSLLRSLYDVLTIGIRRAGKPTLVGQCWFTVTNTKTSKFQYFFSRDRIDQVADVLVKSQIPEFSPFELAVCLVADEATDTFWELHLDDKTCFLSLPFSNLTSLRAEPTHWVAEKNLFQGSDIAAREVSSVNDQSLLINCPKELAAELEEIITESKPMLEHLFREHLRPYRAFRESVSKIAKRMRESVASRGLTDFASSTIAKVVKEIVTPGP